VPGQNVTDDRLPTAKNHPAQPRSTTTFAPRFSTTLVGTERQPLSFESSMLPRTDFADANPTQAAGKIMPVPNVASHANGVSTIQTTPTPAVFEGLFGAGTASTAITATSPEPAAAPQALTATVAQSPVAAKELQTQFPQTKIEAVITPVETQAPTGDKPVAETIAETKMGSPPVSRPNITAALPQRQQPDQPVVVQPSTEYSGKQPVPAPVKPITAPAGMASPTELKNKSLSTPATTETDAKPAPPPVNPDTAAQTKLQAETARTGDTPRAQFVVEPSSFRSPLKLPAEIRLRVVPESLGAMKLQLRTVENHLTARVIVHSSHAQTAVEGNLAQLQRSLADAGLVIDRFEVTVGHTAGTTPTHPDADSQRRRHTFKPKTNRRYQAAAGLKKTAPASAGPSRSMGALVGHHTLNMVA
jgi:flagellar hook-length control protein FliK